MKRIFLFLFAAAIAAAASAQTAPKTPSPAPSTAKAAPAAHSASSAASPGLNLPAGVPRIAHGPLKISFALRYEDIRIGTGAEGEPDKLWHIKYTGWRAADGIKFDSWDDHRQPIAGADGKPELGPDGKPKLGEPEPMAVPQGMGRVIPGFDYGVAGMRVGGKRRLFIPWQMAYGTHNIPDRPDHPGIPPKSDIIFDVELVEVTDMPTPQQRPFSPGRPLPQAPPHPATPGNPGTPGTAPGSGSPSAPPAPGATPNPSAPSSAPGSSSPSPTPPPSSTPPDAAPPTPPPATTTQPPSK